MTTKTTPRPRRLLIKTGLILVWIIVVAGAMILLKGALAYWLEGELAARPHSQTWILFAAPFAILFGIVAGGSATAVVVLFWPWWNCPACGMLLPRFRRARTFGQFLRGGWHCRRCHTDFDRHLRKVDV